MIYRVANEKDATGIAQLHADSWRRNYRGAYLDSYLDGDVVTERVAFWTGRLSAPAGDSVTIVADSDGGVMGFAHTVLDDDPRWGALLDNLHVSHALKGTGVGTCLMAETASAVLRARPGDGLFLWVLEQNEAAQAFYEARLGQRADRRLAGPFPGGGRAFALRYVWPDPAILVPDRPRRPTDRSS